MDLDTISCKNAHARSSACLKHVEHIMQCRPLSSSPDVQAERILRLEQLAAAASHHPEDKIRYA